MSFYDKVYEVVRKIPKGYVMNCTQKSGQKHIKSV